MHWARLGKTIRVEFAWALVGTTKVIGSKTIGKLFGFAVSGLTQPGE